MSILRSILGHFWGAFLGSFLGPFLGLFFALQKLPENCSQHRRKIDRSIEHQNPARTRKSITVDSLIIENEKKGVLMCIWQNKCRSHVLKKGVLEEQIPFGL